MHICLPELYLPEKDVVSLIGRYLKSWTEIPLSPCSGYDKEKLKFYDGFLGTLIRKTEEALRENPQFACDPFINSWKYQGKLYRVLHACEVKDCRYRDGYRTDLPKVDYHGMISHWTDDYRFEGLMYKLSPKEKYIILEADSGEHIGFDVNRFREAFGFQEHFTKGEREIIFPMYKDCIMEHRMTIEEFVQLKETPLTESD